MADDLNVNVNLKGNASEFVGAANQASKAVESLAAKVAAQYAQINAVALRTKEIVTNVFVGEPVAAVQRYAENLRLVAQSTNAWSVVQRAFFNSLTIGWQSGARATVDYSGAAKNALAVVQAQSDTALKTMLAGWQNNQTQVQQFALAWNTALDNVTQKNIAATKAMYDSWTSGWTNPQPTLASQFTTAWNNALNSVQQKAQQTAVSAANSFQQGFANAQANAQKVAQFTSNLQMAVARAMSSGGPVLGPALPAALPAALPTAQQIKPTVDAVTTLSSRLTAATVAFGAFAVAGVKAFNSIVGKAQEVMKSFNKLGESVYRLKLATGDTTEEVSAFRYVAEMAGVTSTSLEMRWAMFSKALVQNNKYVKALNIEYKNANGTFKTAGDLMTEVGEKLQSMTDAEKREASANALFGRGFKDIMPLLVMTRKEKERLIEVAKKSGSILSDDDLNAQRNFAMATRQLNAAIQGLYFSIGKSLVPMFKAMAQGAMNLVILFRQFWESNSMVAKIIKFVAATGAVLVVVLGGLALAIKAAGLATLGFKLMLDLLLAHPIILTITIITTVLIMLALKFDWAQKIVVGAMGVIAAAIGVAASVIIMSFQAITSGIAAVAYGVGKVAGWLGKTFHIGWLESAGDAVSNFVVDTETKLTKLALSLPGKGWSLANELGNNVFNGLKDSKLGAANLGFADTGAYDPTIGGGGGKAKNKLLEHFKQMVDASRASLNALIDEAKNAKKQMDDTAKSVRDSLRGAFSITELADATGGGRSGQAMISLFQRRLSAMRGFVDNIRKLRGMGIPSDWLGEIVNAGVEKGAALAQMLVNQPNVLNQLTVLREQMNVETQAAGEFVGQAMYGDKIAEAIARSTAYQSQFQKLLTAGKRVGYQPTAEDKAIATQNIANAVYMNVGTNADPYAIENAIAWALKTGVGGASRRRPPRDNSWTGGNQNSWVGGFGPEYGNGGYRPGNQYGSFGPEYGYWGGMGDVNQQTGATDISGFHIGAEA